MSELLAQAAFKALKSDDPKWKQLYVTCDANRLLAIYFWFLVEENCSSGPAVDIYSKALRSVANAEHPIQTVEALLRLDHIEPPVSKVASVQHFVLSDGLRQIVTDYLWKRYPPDINPAETEDGDEEVHTRKRHPSARRAKPYGKLYRPAIGSSNYAFLITLLQAKERGDSFLTKADLMAEAETSGLCHSSIYGRDPLYYRKTPYRRYKNGAAPHFTGWQCLSTMKTQKSPWVEIFGRPRKVVLTPSGVEIATLLRDEARAEGRLKEPIKREDLLERKPPAPATLEPPQSDDIVMPALDWLPRETTTIRPEEKPEASKISIQTIEPVLLPYNDPESTFDDEFELILAVDQREQFSRTQPNAAARPRNEALETHMETLKQAGVSVSMRQLNIGDALWLARKKPRFSDGGEEYLLDWIVERKRVDDLAASIVDTRYEQQKYWLRQCGVSNVVYVVEGDPDVLERGHPVHKTLCAMCAVGNAVRTATVATEMVDGFRVVRTENYRETLKFYARFTDTLKRTYSRPASLDATREAITFQSFHSQLSGIKRVTYRQIWGIMITRVAGIGAESATILTDRYPTPKAFYEAKHEDEEFVTTVQELRSQTVGNNGPAISLRGVSLSFRHGRVKQNVLKGLSVDLYPGKLHFLVGPNGCGKSTLLRLLAGLYHADRGAVQTVAPVGYVLQNPDHQVVMPTVASDVAFSLGSRRRDPQEVQQRVTAALKSVDMLDYYHSPISTLSGGQKQRVAIAGALVSRPKLLLLDELTTFIDEEDQERVVQSVRHIVESDPDVTALWVTHRFEEFQYADSVTYMDDGQIMCAGRPKKVIAYVRQLGARI